MGSSQHQLLSVPASPRGRSGLSFGGVGLTRLRLSLTSDWSNTTFPACHLQPGPGRGSQQQNPAGKDRVGGTSHPWRPAAHVDHAREAHCSLPAWLSSLQAKGCKARSIWVYTFLRGQLRAIQNLVKCRTLARPMEIPQVVYLEQEGIWASKA